MSETRLLDLTRLVSRYGKGPQTGVDRVEQAYLSEFLSRETPVFGLVRTGIGFLLLDRTGMQDLRDQRLDLRRVDLLSRLSWRNDPRRARVETALRRVSIARCFHGKLMAMLARHIAKKATYFAVGHANLGDRCLSQIKATGCKIVVLVHDSIPLDFPQFARVDTIASFEKKLRAVAAFADLVIHTTQDARRKTELHFSRFGRVPKGVTARLGVVTADPIPLRFATEDPYFLSIGTIEPRKNHAVLLDAWQAMPDPRPKLYIVGGRGWANEAVFSRLDAMPEHGPIEILSDLADGEVTTLLLGAKALLFPSFAEGFGIPAIEAAALGTPLILSDLEVFKELLQNSAVYLHPDDSYSWMETIARLATAEHKRGIGVPAPTWAAHFNQVFTAVA